jgi:hypothetical protein
MHSCAAAIASRIRGRPIVAPRNLQGERNARRIEKENTKLLSLQEAVEACWELGDQLRMVVPSHQQMQVHLP